jgi:hypothetical protein
MPIKPGEFERQLKHKFGFVPAKDHSVDHIWLKLELIGLPTIFTKLSHSGDELRDKLIGKIARQLRVRGPFLREMIGCTKSRDEYYRQVRQEPVPPFDRSAG